MLSNLQQKIDTVGKVIVYFSRKLDTLRKHQMKIIALENTMSWMSLTCNITTGISKGEKR